MRKRVLVVLLAMSALSPSFARATIAGNFCDGQASQIYARGVPSAIYPTYRVLVSGLYRRCVAERGLITVQQGSDADIVRAILYRDGGVWELDRPLTTAELAQVIPDVHPPFLLRTSALHQIPLYGEGLAIGVNLSCTKAPINLRSSVLSSIYLGLVTRWNDPILVADNPTLSGCKVPIRVAVQANMDHFTDEFKTYLANRNREWLPYIERSPEFSWTPYSPNLQELAWPPTLHASCIGRGDKGMATCVAGFPGAIGYVSFEQAFHRGLRTAQVENAAGMFVPAASAQCTTAMATATAAYPPTTLADWSLAPILDPALGYPICGITFGVAFQFGEEAYGGAVSNGQLRTVVDYLATAIGKTAQDKLERLGYARLPVNLEALSSSGIGMIALSYP